MKDEIKDLVEDMTNIFVCALQTRKYASLPQLEKTINDLEDVAKEVKDLVQAYNHTSQSSTSFAITALMMTCSYPKQKDFYCHSYLEIKTG